MGFEELADQVNRSVSSALGIAAVWTPKGGDVSLPFGVPLQAIFRREHRTFDPDTGAMISTAQSAAWIRLADLPRLPIEDDGLELDGRRYVVAALEPDGQGGAWLVLQLAPTP
jgi:hypothetical protein